jgi:hypothetical protein
MDPEDYDFTEIILPDLDGDGDQGSSKQPISFIPLEPKHDTPLPLDIMLNEYMPQEPAGYEEVEVNLQEEVSASILLEPLFDTPSINLEDENSSSVLLEPLFDPPSVNLEDETSSSVLLEPLSDTPPVNEENTQKEPLNIQDLFDRVNQITSQKQNDQITLKQVVLAFTMLLLFLNIYAPLLFVSFDPSSSDYSSTRPVFSPAVKFRMRRPIIARIIASIKKDEIPYVEENIPKSITGSIAAFVKNLNQKILRVLVFLLFLINSTG